MEIKAEVKKIESLKDFFFVVPDYQREYVWEAETNVDRFLQDINEEFDPSSSEQTSYFIGSTIIVKRKDGQYDVIDGQQRLTTIIITLCAMREQLKKLALNDDENEELGETRSELLKTIQELLYKFSIAHSKKTPRLVLQYEESRDFLQKLIEGKEYQDDETNSIKRMRDGYKTIVRFLQNQEETSSRVLIDFIRYFLVNVEMVIIMPDDLGSALKIFETINERGVGLNAMDLLKNLLFSNSREDEFTEIKNIWKSIMQNLNECGEGDKPLRFLKYFIVARYHNGMMREEDIYKWVISKPGKEAIKYELQPVKFAKEILRASARYKSFVKATGSVEADASFPSITGIGYLSKKNSRQHILLLLALKDSFDDAGVNLLAQNIESLMFYYSVLKILTKTYESLFSNWAVRLRSLRTNDELKTFIKTEIATEINKRSAEFLQSFEYKRQTDIQPQYTLKYIFGQIENFIRENVGYPKLNIAALQQQQLEHVLPQTPLAIPQEKYQQEEDYWAAVYKLGNLTLLEGPINQSLNHTNDIATDQWFEQKTEAYRNSNILMSNLLGNMRVGYNTTFNKFVATNFSNYDSWGMEQIVDRQQTIRDLMMKVWSVRLN